MQKLLAIVGPTASGKSAVALRVAETIGGEIISADSRQIYRHMDIGTAKPSAEDRRKVRHYFIDIFEPDKDYSAGEYGRDALMQIREVGNRGMTPILVGGSGLYVKSVIDGFFDGPGRDPEIRSRLERQLKEEGAESIFRTLESVDPRSAATMDATKPRRVIRALEVFYITGKPISQFHDEQSGDRPFNLVEVGFSWPRESLYRRIDERVDLMFSQGLVEEVERLRAKGYAPSLNALNTVGYKEVFDYLNGNVNREEMVGLVKRNSRRFAKRQLTWFRSDKRIRWIETDAAKSEIDLTSEVVNEFSKS